MYNFEIQIEPSVRGPSNVLSNFADLNFQWKKIITEIPGYYQVIYHAAGDSFAYYPAEIMTVYNDMTGELVEFKASKSHYVSLAGYNVAYARCKDGKVWFYDPPWEFGTEDQVELKGDGIPLNVVVQAFERAASAVWELIVSRVKLDN